MTSKVAVHEIVERVESFKASPFPGRYVKTLELVFSEEPPDPTTKEWESDWRQMYELEGDRIEAALFRTIPGGLYDQILRAMLTRGASLLKVTHTKD